MKNCIYPSYCIMHNAQSFSGLTQCVTPRSMEFQNMSISSKYGLLNIDKGWLDIINPETGEVRALDHMHSFNLVIVYCIGVQ